MTVRRNQALTVPNDSQRTLTRPQPGQPRSERGSHGFELKGRLLPKSALTLLRRSRCRYKYDRETLDTLVASAGFRITRLWTDAAERFWVAYLDAA